MSLATGNTATSADIKAFKTALDNELFSTSRRAAGQSPYGYGRFVNEGSNATLDNGLLKSGFTHGANVGDQIKTSHYYETVGYITMNFKNTSNNPVGWPVRKNSGDTLGQIWDIYNLLVNHLAKLSPTTGNALCQNAYCSGLCQGTCTTGCMEGCTSEHGNCSNYLGGPLHYSCNQ